MWWGQSYVFGFAELKSCVMKGRRKKEIKTNRKTSSSDKILQQKGNQVKETAVQLKLKI